MNDNLLPSANCIALVERAEGFAPNLYWDVKGWSIGFGCFIGNDPATIAHYKSIQPLSRQQAEDLLRSRLQPVVDALKANVTVSVNQNQFDALVDWAYNEGPGVLQPWNPKTGHGSNLVTLLNQGNFAGAVLEFPKWCKAGGQVIPGLLARRQEETTLFNTVV
jgi:GH24 family phage-related lysozyme (muramidase)